MAEKTEQSALRGKERAPILEPGDRLDRDLTVLDHLGGTRKVDLYICRSKKLKRLVACKVLRPEFCINFSALSDVLREGQVLQKLRHPNVVEGYSVQLEEYPRIVMQYLQGQTVAAAFLSGNYLAFEVEDALSVAAQIADALTYVHESGLLHLDVKPSNVMYHEGHATLFDFSVAEYFSPEKPMKDNAGTRQYMAPEQTYGREVGHYTDVFGLGVLFFQLLTGGRYPYPEVTLEGTDDGAKAKRLDYTGLPSHPSSLNSSVPWLIGDVALAALQPDPKARVSTPLEFLEELEKASRLSLLERHKFRRNEADPNTGGTDIQPTVDAAKDFLATHNNPAIENDPDRPQESRK